MAESESPVLEGPLSPGHYSRPHQLLISMFARDVERLRERWHDEAAVAALDNNPRRAGFIEYMAGRLR